MPKNGPASSSVPRNSARDIQPSLRSPSLLAFFFITWKPGVLKEDFPQLLRTVSVVAVRGGAHLADSAHCNFDDHPFQVGAREPNPSTRVFRCGHNLAKFHKPYRTSATGLSSPVWFDH